MEPVLTQARPIPEGHTLKSYLDRGGYEGLKKALTLTPEEIIEEVKRSGLRGRGGAGFPTGLKWSFVPKDSPKPRYVVCNADEGEPGTFKDKVIMRYDPHMLLEGIMIACLAIKAERAYIYIRGEFVREAEILHQAIQEAMEAGYLGENCLKSGKTIHITVHRGAGAYICGEETGLIESLEGDRGHPRLKPPFPASVGVFGCPTVVNNVETLACVPHIFRKGVEWFASIGPNPKNTGPKLYCLSGSIQKPGVYEFPMGYNLKKLIYEVGKGPLKARPLKGVIPGGLSAPILKPGEIDIPMDFDTLMASKSMLGSAGIIVLDDTACMVKVAWRTAQFFAEESCGQCSPCREGTRWLELILHRFIHGKGKKEDLDLMKDIIWGMKGTTICVLSDGCAMAVEAMLIKYYDEFEAHIDGGCQHG